MTGHPGENKRFEVGDLVELAVSDVHDDDLGVAPGTPIPVPHGCPVQNL